MNRNLDFAVGVPLSGLLSIFSQKKTPPTDPKKILIIKLAAAGDTILLRTVLKAFRAAHPDSVLHWLVSPVNAALSKTIPYVDERIVWSGGLSSLPALIGKLRSERYDAVVDLEQWSRGTAILSFLSGAPHRLGYDTPGQHRAGLFTAAVPKRYERHEIFDFYGILALLGSLEERTDLEWQVTDAGREEAKQLAPFFNKKERRLTVLLHPGCGSDGLPREWPINDYAVLAHWLMKKFQADIVLTGGPEETKKTRQLNELLQRKANDLGGKLSWDGLAAMVDQVDLVISGNTGVMHLAAALKKRQVALHGPTDSRLWGPLNPLARVVSSLCPRCPCLRLGFEYHALDQSCMKQIDVETVKKAVESSIDSK